MNSTTTLDLRGLSQERRTRAINECVYMHVMQQNFRCRGDLKQTERDDLRRRTYYTCLKCEVELTVTDSYREGGLPLPQVHTAKIPDYSTSMDAAFTMMRSMLDHLFFSKRQGFYRQLAYVISQSHGMTDSTIAWPDAMGLMKPEHVCIAALGMFEVEVIE